MRDETFTYDADGATLKSRLFYEELGEPRPAVLVFPEAFGLSEHALSRAQRLAAMGYVNAADAVLISGAAERLSYHQIAKTITNMVGRPFHYDELSLDTWHAEFVVASAAKGEPNVRGADHLAAQAVALRSRPPMQVTDHVRRLAGREPITFRAFVEAHRADLTPGA